MRITRYLLSIAVLAGTVGLFAAAERSRSASGFGTMSFGEQGVGLLDFKVKLVNGITTGTLLFAAEDHHGFPHYIVRVKEIDKAVFGGPRVKMEAKGMLHDEPVAVKVTATDGAGRGKPDTFSIRCTNADHEVVLQANGKLFRGDIKVGADGSSVSGNSER